MDYIVFGLWQIWVRQDLASFHCRILEYDVLSAKVQELAVLHVHVALL